MFATPDDHLPCPFTDDYFYPISASSFLELSYLFQGGFIQWRPIEVSDCYLCRGGCDWREMFVAFYQCTTLLHILTCGSVRKKGKMDRLDKYLGHLCSAEEYKVYGFITNTDIKLLIVCILRVSSHVRFKDHCSIGCSGWGRPEGSRIACIFSQLPIPLYCCCMQSLLWSKHRDKITEIWSSVDVLGGPRFRTLLVISRHFGLDQTMRRDISNRNRLYWLPETHTELKRNCHL